MCDTFPTRYPLRVRQTAGGVISDTPIICGGYNPDTKTRVRACYSHQHSTNKWKFLVNLTTFRQDHAAVALGDALWLTGGEVSFGQGLRSTEYVYSNGTVIQGPELPSGIGAHCMVRLEDGRVMILGKVPNRRAVIIYNSKTNKFTEAPRLLYGRLYHACTIFKSPMHGGRPVVISIGGYSGRTSEVLDYTRNGSVWEEGNR